MNNCDRIIGAWHRPNSSERETNLEELCTVLDEFKAAGINTIFLETYFHGMTVLKTDLIDYRTKLRGYSYGDYPDYLTAFVEEADKRGIGVHAWVQDFYVGYKEETPIVEAHPEWMLINQHGSRRHTTEGQGFGGYLFLDPANPEVREFLVKLYDEILTKVPKIKGLNLDYIRYPISEIEENTDTGFTECCMSDFAEKEVLKLHSRYRRKSLIRKIAENNLADKWIAHRAGYVTEFVRQVHEMVSEKHPGKLISTAVFSEVEKTYTLKKQNVRVWIDSGYINMVTPMVYFYESSQVYDAVKKLSDMCSAVKCYSGLYTTYHKQTVEELDSHIKVSLDAGAKGFVLFDSAKTFFEAEHDYVGYLSSTYGKQG